MKPPVEPPAASPAALDAWRAEVGALRARERRRRFPLGVHVGTPGRRRVSSEVPWPVPPEYDAGLRLDVVAGLLEAAAADAETAAGADAETAGADGAEAAAWLTRPGEPVLHDRDLEWYSAAAHAFGAQGLRLVAFRAVTRSGWLDVVSGERRVWRRLRL